MDGGALAVEPVTADRWDDVLSLFGERGAYSGCWCMWWRTTAAEFDRNVNDGNRAAFRALVLDDRVPGLLAYREGTPVGWCCVAPREELGRLQRSPHTKPVDDTPDVWAVVCFYVDRPARGTGVATALLDAAVDHAFARGARAVEGVPLDPSRREVDAASAYTGVVQLFERAGFREIARRSEKGRVVMRREPGR